MLTRVHQGCTKDNMQIIDTNGMKYDVPATRQHLGVESKTFVV